MTVDSGSLWGLYQTSKGHLIPFYAMLWDNSCPANASLSHWLEEKLDKELRLDASLLGAHAVMEGIWLFI